MRHEEGEGACWFSLGRRRRRAVVEGILLTGRENFEVVLKGNGGAGQHKHILLVATR